MPRCCDGKNAYKPVTKTRYLLGFVLFYIMHIQCRILMSLRHIFIKKYSRYNILSRFFKVYFRDTLTEIKEKKGLVIKNQSCTKD